LAIKITILAAEDLKSLPCSDCGQIHADSSDHHDRLTLGPKCHDKYSVVAVYDRKENALALFCGYCGTFVVGVEPK
jgi:hypothetical protein